MPVTPATLRFATWSGAQLRHAVDGYVVGVLQGATQLAGDITELPGATRRVVSQWLARGRFRGRPGETTWLQPDATAGAAPVLLVGLGEQRDFDRRAWCRACAAAVAEIDEVGFGAVLFCIDRPVLDTADPYRLGRDFAETCSTALYRTLSLKTLHRPRATILRLAYLSTAPAEAAPVRRGLDHGAAVGRAMNRVRDLGNLPGNVCTPRYLAQVARRLATTHRSLRVKVFDPAGIRRLGMGCLQAVAQGSAEPPRFIQIEYAGRRRRQRPVVLVGKGITFDSGGLTPKAAVPQESMKYDMCGAGVVLALLALAAELRLPGRVVGLIAAAENMPGGRAMKPGDVVTSASGQTVEILNPDAEGRLVLCDALHYARRFEPAAVIDVATLTDSCVTALGSFHSGLLANDDGLAAQLQDCGRQAADPVWRLPLTRDYDELLDTEFADVANVGGHHGGNYEGGAITAASFLARFTRDLRWAHLDVAGVAYRTAPRRQVTGRPVPLLAEFLLQHGVG